MKSLNHLKLSLLAGLALMAVSCTDENAPDIVPPTGPVAQALTSGSSETWGYTRWTLLDLVPVTIPSCSQDDRFTFNADGTFNVKITDITCTSIDLDGGGFWTVSGDTLVTLNYGTPSLVVLRSNYRIYSANADSVVFTDRDNPTLSIYRLTIKPVDN